MLLGLLREERVDLGLHLVARRLEARPERLAFVLRRLLRELPEPVELVEHRGRALEVRLRHERFGARREVLLHGHVGEALPLHVLAQLLQQRVELAPRRLEPGEELVALAPGGEVPGVRQGLLDLAQGVIGVAQRGSSACRDHGLGAAREGCERFHVRALLRGELRPLSLGARAQARGDRLPPLGELRHLAPPRRLAPARLELAEGGLCGRELLARERLRLDDQRHERLAPRHERLVYLAAGLRLARAPGGGLLLASRRGLALERGAGMLVGALLGFVLCSGRCGDGPRHGRLHGRLAGLQAGASPARRGRHASLCGDGVERVGIGQPVDRCHRERLLLEVLGEPQDRRAVLDPAERQEPRLLVERLANHVGERPRVSEGVKGRLAHAGERGALRHACEVLRLAQAENGRPGLSLVLLVDRQVDEPAPRFLAHPEVGIGARDLGQHGDLGEALDGRAPHAGVGVLACEGQDQLVIRRRQPQHRLRAHRRVFVLPLGPAAEPVDEGLEGRLRQGCLRAPDYTSGGTGGAQPPESPVPSVPAMFSSESWPSRPGAPSEAAAPPPPPGA